MHKLHKWWPGARWFEVQASLVWSRAPIGGGVGPKDSNQAKSAVGPWWTFWCWPLLFWWLKHVETTCRFRFPTPLADQLILLFGPSDQTEEKLCNSIFSSQEKITWRNVMVNSQLFIPFWAAIYRRRKGARLLVDVPCSRVNCTVAGGPWGPFRLRQQEWECVGYNGKNRQQWVFVGNFLTIQGGLSRIFCGYHGNKKGFTWNEWGFIISYGNFRLVYQWFTHNPWWLNWGFCVNMEYVGDTMGILYSGNMMGFTFEHFHSLSWKTHLVPWFTYHTSWFFKAMLVYQRVPEKNWWMASQSMARWLLQQRNIIVFNP